MLIATFLTLMLNHAIHPDKFDKLAECESHKNAQAVSPDSRYYGAFQFDLTTWQELGMLGSPTEYSYKAQKDAAKVLYRQRGWQPWPTCREILDL